jgi:hypothetical protein
MWQNRGRAISIVNGIYEGMVVEVPMWKVKVAKGKLHGCLEL